MPYCPEKYAAMIEQFRSFSKVSEMMNLFQSFDDGADLFNNPIILNMMNQTVNTTNNTANPKNSKDGNTPGKTDVKAPPPKKTPADGAQNEPNVSTDTTGHAKKPAHFRHKILCPSHRSFKYASDPGAAETIRYLHENAV